MKRRSRGTLRTLAAGQHLVGSTRSAPQALILQALERTGWQHGRAAEALGIGRPHSLAEALSRFGKT